LSRQNVTTLKVNDYPLLLTQIYQTITQKYHIHNSFLLKITIHPEDLLPNASLKKELGAVIEI
jgi:hypothetical protein